jgi:two-component system, OmpR family, osmolarity sensor histidine kinase EnvZ
VHGTAAREARELMVTVDGAQTVLADGADLARVLDVLLENALVYGRGAIEVRASGPVISVADRGPGLAPGEEDGRLLERFRRGSAGRSHQGTGLGLAIADALAGHWGCSVELKRRDGGGVIAVLDCSGGVP